MTKRWRTSLLVWILVVSVLPVVPVVLFAGLVSARHLGRLQQDLQVAVPERAAAAAAVVDSRLAVAAASLAVLASDDAATRGDVAALHAHALRVVANHSDGAVIRLIDADGRLLFSTAPEAGPGAQALLARQVLQVDGPRPQTLTLSVPTGAFTQMLLSQAWPEGWVAAVVDPQYLIVGRNRDAARFVGQPVSDTLRRALAEGNTSLIQSQTKEGTPVFTAVAPVGRSAWRVAVGAPRALLTGEYQRTLALLAGGAGLSLGLAALASWLVSRWLRSQVRGMLAAAREAAAGGPDSLADHSILELEPVSEALREATARERQQSGELDQARHDPLTGLSTRAWLLQRAQAERHGMQRHGDGNERCAALFIDLDGFKQVNDRHGHERGDQVLAEVGACILDAVRGHDLAGRWGGDEFVVCLAAPAGLVTAVARAVAERIVNRVAALGDGIACSVGVAVDIDGHSDVDGLVRHADAAMLQAKRAGKNQVVLSMH